MKKLLLTLALAVGAINSGFAADLYVNNSGQSGTYTTIQAAINAASTGDNIYVSPLNSYQESLSITKSIRIASSVAGSRIIVTQDIKISPLANILVELIGIEGTSVILDSQTSTLSANSRGQAILSDCSFLNVNLDIDYLTLILIKCSLNGSLTTRHGKIVGNSITGNLNVHDEPNVGIGDSILIKANHVNGEIKVETNDHSVIIENNVSNGIRVGKWAYSVLLTCEISNNTVNQIGSTGHWNSSSNRWDLQCGLINIQSASTTDFSNVFITNNKAVFDNPYVYTGTYGRSAYSLVGIDAHNYVTNKPNIQYNFWAFDRLSWTYNVGSGTESSTVSSYRYLMAYYIEVYRSGTTAGGTYGEAKYFSMTQAGINNQFWDLKTNVISNPYDLNSFNNELTDAGSPSPKFFDADLTRSDIGHLGGDNSWEMFHGTNSVTGAAYIIGLDLPSEIWPGQTVNLKAEAVHTN